MATITRPFPLRAKARPKDPSDRSRLELNWSVSADAETLQDVEEPGKAYSDAFRALDLHALPREEPGERTQHRDPMVSPGLDRAPSLRTGGDASNPEPVVGGRDPPAHGPERARHALDAIRFLHAQLLRAPDDALAASMARAQGEQRQLVDQERHLLGGDLGRDQLGRGDLEIGDGLAARLPPVVDGDPRAHALEHVEEARPGPVDADPVQAHLRPRAGGRRGQERRGRGEVARDVEGERLEPPGGADGGSRRAPPAPP